MWTIAQWAMFKFTHKEFITREGNALLPLGVVKFCAFANYSGDLKGRGRRCEKRHAGKVSIECG
jgi:hypothetical protein